MRMKRGTRPKVYPAGIVTTQANVITLFCDGNGRYNSGFMDWVTFFPSYSFLLANSIIII